MRSLVVGISTSLVALAAGPGVAQTVVRDAEYLANYGLDVINPLPAYALGLTGAGITFAFVDTGVDTEHPEFAGRISPDGRNFGADGAPDDPTDDGGHGTGIAGIISAARDGVGMHGVAFRSTLVPLRALSTDIEPDEIEDPTTMAVTYAAQLRVKVLNGSYSIDALPQPFIQDPAFPNAPDKQIANPNYAVLGYKPIVATNALLRDYQAVKAAAEADVVMVFGAGNNFREQPVAAGSPDGVSFYPAITPASHLNSVYALLAVTETVEFNNPATYQGLALDDPLFQTLDFADLKGALIAVVALNKEGVIADYSNRCGIAAEWCLTAPGGSNTPETGIFTTTIGGNYDVESGTSEATPHVAGAAVLVREAFPYMTARQVIATLLTTATDLGSPEIYGQGLVNLGRAVGGPGRFDGAGFNVDTQGFDSVWSNDISGTGGLVKRGAGTLRLTGASVYTGPTEITGGTLVVDGNLISATRVGAGGTLGGEGRVGFVNVETGGILAPGNGVGLLTAEADVTFLVGSTFLVDVVPATSDLLAVDGAASLDGNLILSFGAGSYSYGAQYTVLTTGGARTGAFAVTLADGDLAPAFAPVVDYTPSSVLVTLRPASLDAQLGVVGGSRNVRNFAAAFDATAADEDFNADPFIPLLLQRAGVASAVNQLTGELRAAERKVALEDSRHVREAALDRLGIGLGARTHDNTAATQSGGFGVWGRTVGAWGDIDGDGNSSPYDTRLRGGLFGIDFGGHGWRIGAAFTFTSTEIEYGSLGISDVESTGGALYAGYRSDAGIAVGIGASLAKVDSRGIRTITVLGLGQTLRGEGGGETRQAFGEIAYDIAASDRVRIEPFGRIAYVELHADAFLETGGVAVLTGPRQTYDILVALGGVRGKAALGAPGAFAVYGSAAYQHTSGDRDTFALIGLAGGGALAAVSATPLDKHALAAEAGLEWRAAPTFRVGLGYTGTHGKRSTDHGGKLTLSYGF